MCGDNSYGQIGNGHDGSGFPTLYKDIVTEPYFTLGNCVEFTVIDHTSVKAKTINGTTYDGAANMEARRNTWVS